MERKLVRSKRDRIFGGVCGGVAEYFGWQSWMVRFAYVLVSILSAAFPGILIYILLWIFMPEQSDPPPAAGEIPPQPEV